MPGLYDRERPVAFWFFGTLTLLVTVFLVPWSFLGLLMVVPGILGIIGLIGLANACYGLTVPSYVWNANEGILIRLCFGLSAAVLGWYFYLARVERAWQFVAAIALYAVLATFFIIALTLQARKERLRYFFGLKAPAGACLWVTLIVGGTLLWPVAGGPIVLHLATSIR